MPSCGTGPRGLLRRIAALSYERAGELLVEAGESVPVAIVMARLSLDRKSAETRLAAAGGRIAEAIKNRLVMDKFRIHGGVPLEGEIAISGAKNSALPALAACLLTSEPVKLQRIPPVRDIGTMQQLLQHSGAELVVYWRRRHRSGQGSGSSGSAV